MSAKRLIGITISVPATEIPEDAAIQDRGEFWSPKIYTVFAGADAESIE
ncbi:MAG: hypothetical protein AB7D42_00900 [Candidatus Methanomethylophilaceae archaeon]